MHPDLKAAGDLHNKVADAYRELFRQYIDAKRVDRGAAEAKYLPLLEKAEAARITAGGRHSLMITLYAPKRPSLVAL